MRNNSNEISEFCRTSREPVFITKNGVGDMVVLSIEMYERQQAQLRLRGYRTLLVKNYMVFYIIKDDTVEIHRILYARRQYGGLLWNKEQ